jgi:hypothetical protein
LTENAKIISTRDEQMNLTFMWEGPADGLVAVPQYVPHFALGAMPWKLERVGSDQTRKVDFYRRALP